MRLLDIKRSLCVPLQVLHTRSCSGMGLHFVRFLVACYLCFNMDYSSVTLALASLPPTMPPRRLTSGTSHSQSLVLPFASTACLLIRVLALSWCSMMVSQHAC